MTTDEQVQELAKRVLAMEAKQQQLHSEWSIFKDQVRAEMRSKRHVFNTYPEVRGTSFGYIDEVPAAAPIDAGRAVAIDSSGRAIPALEAGELGPNPQVSAIACSKCEPIKWFSSSEYLRAHEDRGWHRQPEVLQLGTTTRIPDALLPPSLRSVEGVPPPRTSTCSWCNHPIHCRDGHWIHDEPYVLAGRPHGAEPRDL